MECNQTIIPCSADEHWGGNGHIGRLMQIEFQAAAICVSCIVGICWDLHHSMCNQSSLVTYRQDKLLLQLEPLLPCLAAAAIAPPLHPTYTHIQGVPATVHKSNTSIASEDEGVTLKLEMISLFFFAASLQHERFEFYRCESLIWGLWKGDKNTLKFCFFFFYHPKEQKQQTALQSKKERRKK